MAKRKKASASQRARLKALRKKHGLGEFKNKSRPKVRSISRSSNRMAKKKGSHSKKKTFMSGLQKPLMAGLTFALVQPFVSQFLKRFNIGIQDELLTILFALIIRTVFKNQFVKLWADMAISINVASLMRGLSSRLLPAFNMGSASAPSQSQFPPV